MRAGTAITVVSKNRIHRLELSDKRTTSGTQATYNFRDTGGARYVEHPLTHLVSEKGHVDGTSVACKVLKRQPGAGFS